MTEESAVDILDDLSKFGTQISRFFSIVLITRFFIYVESFIALKIFSNVLSTTEYGFYSFSIVFANTFVLIFTSFFTDGISRYVISYEESNEYKKTRDIIFTGLIFLFFLELAAWSAIILLNFLNIRVFNHPQYLALLIAISLFGLISSLNAIFSNVIKARQMLRWYIAFELLSVFLGLLMGLVFVFMFAMRELGIFIGLIIGNFCSFLAFLIYFLLKSGSGSISINQLRKITKFGIPSVSMLIVGSTHDFIMNYIILLFVSAEAVAFFAIGSTVAGLFNLPFIGLQAAFPVIVTQMWEQKKEEQLKVFTAKLVRLLIALGFLFVIFLYAVSPFLIVFVSNVKYLPALIIIPFYLPALFFGLITTIINTSCYVRERMEIVAKSYIIAHLSSMAFFVLIPFLELVGAGIAAVAFSVIYFGLSYKNTKRLFQIEYETTKILWTLFSGLICIVSYLILEYFFILHFVLNIIISLTLYVILILFSKAVDVIEIKFITRALLKMVKSS